MREARSFVVGFQDVDRSDVGLVGGKGANLGELSRIGGVLVPEGFCVTTLAFEAVVFGLPRIHRSGGRELKHELKVQDHKRISEISSQIREAIEAAPVPDQVREEVELMLERLGGHHVYAVRSSATAEDLPAASFAGQQDTYLNVIGKEAIIGHIRKCWASLYTDRAVTYRIQNGFDHSAVQLAVVVQKMVFPQVSGILFTADPVSGNREVLSIDASFGLGEALVAGLVNADNYKVLEGKIVEKKISAKKLAVVPLKGGGTGEQEIGEERQSEQALTDAQILELEQIGRKVEAHFGAPQDIEWCLADDQFYIVQSRSITTLFPVPEVNDGQNHVYISVGHQQMMTDAMKPFGISFWQLTAGRPMFQAGGRMFVDVAKDLASRDGRNLLINVLGKSDPLIKDAFTTLLQKEDFIPPLPEEVNPEPAGKAAGGSHFRDFQTLKDYDASIVDDLIRQRQALIRNLNQNIRSKTGSALLDFILESIDELKKQQTNPDGFGVIMTSMNAAAWVNEKMNDWLGEKCVADTFAQSVPHNITSEMGLALLDVADAIRPHPQVIGFLQNTKEDNFLEKLPDLEGGQEASVAIETFLDKYGMRCAGEIDITKTRWSERPGILIPVILGNVKNFEPGESRRKFEKGLQEALNKETELLAALCQLPDGEEKAAETKRMIDLIRNFAGYREYPKYDIITRYFIYKQALQKEAEQLVNTGVLSEKSDLDYLTFEELREVMLTQRADYQLIEKRKTDLRLFEKMTPPRVMTSDGEIITGRYQTGNVPEGAIVGLAVSAGVIEGRARVIFNMENADLEEGDILVTTFTDPSWTPLFVSIKGLVTEVGGLMTHGAVIAREYGLPAVVGVDNATKLIRDGQLIRVNGTEGFIELL